MRFSLFILLFILSFPVLVQADMIKGMIIGVDREKGEITLVPANCRKCRVQPDDPTLGQGNDQQASPATTIITTHPIPVFVKPKAFIRVWGRFSPDNENVFLAERIAGPGWRQGGHDSTGVRSRLRKRCFRQGNPPPGSMHPPPHWNRELK